MRHRKSGRRLNRTSSHRKAMFMNMTVSLLKHGIIRTTVPKAKELRKYVEPLVRLAREDSVHLRRLAFAQLRDKDIVKKLFAEIGPASAERQGGYTRVLRCGYRNGDNAPLAVIELVDRPRESAE